MMPRSFLVKKTDELLISSKDMDIIRRDMERRLDNIDIKIPNVTLDGSSFGQKTHRERDSLHKFAISKMLGITEEEEEKPCTKKVKVEKLDENCNKVGTNEPRCERTHDLSIKPPMPGTAMIESSKFSQRSPNGSPSEPPKMFDHLPWPHPVFPAYPHVFPPYLPIGLRYPGIPPPFPFPPLTDTCSSYKPFADHLAAMRAFLPPHQARFPPVPIIPVSPKHPEKNLDPNRGDSNYQGKLINSAFDPVMSNYSVFHRDKLPVDVDLSTAGKKKDRESEPTRYHCDGCSKVYATFSGLSKHKQFHCASQVKKEFSCKYCEKTYVSLGALKMHIRTHTLPCKCKLCGKAFSRPWLLQGHIRTHTGEKPFRCDHCARAFADRSNLRAHLQTHSDIKKYSCKACSKTFSRMSLLLKHEDSCCVGHHVP